ncbi:MAG: cache domain-containing protein [Caulobacteraceae bacterium]|nr:cache domain-containing protein [Caulobacteraceae bacterium]
MDRRAFVASGALLAVAGASAAHAQAGSATLMIDGRVALEAYRSLVEEHLTGVLRTLKVLAVTTDARSADWERVGAPLRTLSDDMTTAAAVWFVRPDGAYYTTERGLMGETLKDRAYFADLMAGRDVRAALVISKSTGHRSIVVAAPVKRGGAVVGAFGVSVRARLVSDLVAKGAQLPDNLVFYALDAAGRTAIHKDPDRMFQFPSDLGDPSLKAAVATILSRREGRVDYDFGGKHRAALFDRSDVTGWSFVLATLSD